MKSLLICCMIVGIFLRLSNAADNVPPSVNPPGGLSPSQCPMFIAFGFDDNGYPDGVNWIADFIKGKKNPSGNGNPATFDGSTVHSSFFITTGFCTDSLMAGDGTHFKAADVLNSWKRLYTDGNDVGDHTHTHADELQLNHTKSVWDWENNTCIDILTNQVGVPRADIIGFRTPFLMFTKESMQSELDHDIQYDCSIEHYKDLLSQEYVWPYTMDKGQAPSAYIRDPTFTSAPGLWEMPVYEIMTDTNWQAVTGLDYNMWVSKSMTKAQFEYSLKITLDNRLKNNRAPFLIGMHTDYYSQWNDVANGAAKETWQNRRAAVEDFINYALGYNKDIRLVSFKDVLAWVRHPVALGSPVAVDPGLKSAQFEEFSVKLVGRTLKMASLQAGTYRISMYDMRGRMISQIIHRTANNGESVDIPLHNLPSAIYTASVRRCGSNETEVFSGLLKGY